SGRTSSAPSRSGRWPGWGGRRSGGRADEAVGPRSIRAHAEPRPPRSGREAPTHADTWEARRVRTDPLRVGTPGPLRRWSVGKADRESGLRGHTGDGAGARGGSVAGNAGDGANGPHRLAATGRRPISAAGAIGRAACRARLENA